MNAQNVITEVCCDIQGVVEIMKLLSDALVTDTSRYCGIPIRYNKLRKLKVE